MQCAFTGHAIQSDDHEYPDDEFSQFQNGLYYHDVDPLHTNDGRIVIEVPDMIPEDGDGTTDG